MRLLLVKWLTGVELVRAGLPLTFRGFFNPDRTPSQASLSTFPRYVFYVPARTLITDAVRKRGIASFLKSSQLELGEAPDTTII
jgi:hypothetical protein